MNNTPHTNCLTLRLLHAAKGYKAVAFDIFDTLLKRDCAHPADLFALMEVTHQAALGFAGARVAAEAETRQTLGREVTLAEIYAHPALRGTDPAAECAAELAMIAPNRPVAQAAAACHARGQKVYAVSDMYLPKEQIEAMLQKCGLDFLDGVFVSCEYGVQKRSGKLFKLFLQQTALRPAEVLFVGDSPRADFAGAALAGIRCFLLPQPTPLPYTKTPADAVGGVAIATLQNCCQNLNPSAALGAELLGPLAVGFAAWLHGQRAAIPGAKLVFLARDMYLVRQVYQLLYPEEETFYLKVSRQSLLPALLQCPMNEQALALLADTLPRQQLTQRQIAAYLGFDSTKGYTTKTYDLRTRPLPCRTKEMLLAMAAHSKLPEGEPLRRRAEQARAYLEQAGLTDSPVLLVDIGSGGTTQRVLEELLHTQLYGCYLACDARLHQNLPPERAKTFLFDGCPAPLWYWVGQPMLEVLLSEPCGSTVGYHAQAGQMVPEIGQAGADNRAITAPLWQGMRAFVQRWQAGPLREVQIPPQTCIAAFLQMVQAPRMQEVRTLGEITVEDGGSWKLAAPASWGTYLHAPAQLKRDLAQARWKPAFLQRLFGVPLPYGKVYAALKHKK